MKRAKRGTALLLGICMIFITACGAGGEGGETDRAMGRYVENRLEFPLADETPSTMLQRSDGTLDVLYAKYTEDSSDPVTGFTRYHSADGKKWDKETLKWTLPPESFLSCVAYDRQDRAYVTALRYGEGDLDAWLFRENGEGALERMDIALKDETGSPMNIAMLGTMQIGDNGNIFIEQRGRGVSEYGTNGNFIRFYSSGEMGDSSGFVLSGDKIYVLDTVGSGVLCYSTEDGRLVQNIAFDGFSEYSIIGGGSGGTVYISGRTGIYRLNAGGSMWEKLVDGSLTSLAMPSIYFSDFIEGPDGSFYLMGGDGGNTAQLYQYVYDPDIATLPEKELVVYTLRENAALRVAAGEFLRDHPDTRVNIQTAMDEDSAATAADMIRTLNTELLSGKGPDVLLLDGMPVDSYVEKGVLTDLSHLIKEIAKSEKLNETVLNTYKNKDGIFAVPSRFRMPALFTEENFAGDLTGLEALATLAESHPDKPLIGDKSPGNLMNTLFASCAPAWISDGRIDEDGLREFLETVKKIADTPAKSYGTENEGKTGQFSVGSGVRGVSVGKQNKNEDLLHWAFGRALAYGRELRGYGSLSASVLALRHVENSTVIHMPGQAENVYIPCGILGVNAKSEMKDSAEDFVKLLLSEPMQTAENGEGFPVSMAAQKALVDSVDEDVYIGMGGSGTETENDSLEGGMPEPKEKEIFMKLCNSVKTPYTADETLAEMIMNETKGYFTGEKDLEKTVADITEATKLYLSE